METRENANMIHFIVHGEKDLVGVMTVDVKKGQSLQGWNMALDKTLRGKATQNIPLGHKIALSDLSKGQEVIKYDQSIGLVSRKVKKGQHVHTHNLATSRW